MNLTHIDGYIRKYGPVFLFFFVFSIVIAHLYKPDRIPLSWELVSLVVLLVIIPFVPLIKRLKYGDAEAELESLLTRAEQQINDSRVQEKEKLAEPDAESLTESDKESSTDSGEEPSSKDEKSDTGTNRGDIEPEMKKIPEENDLPKESHTDIREITFHQKPVKHDKAVERAENLVEELKSYSNSDNKIALSRLRWEIDKTLKEIAYERNIEYPETGWTVDQLLNEGILSEDDIGDIRLITRITDKAIHGKSVSSVDVRRILDLADTILVKLYLRLEDPVPTDPDTPHSSNENSN